MDTDSSRLASKRRKRRKKEGFSFCASCAFLRLFICFGCCVATSSSLAAESVSALGQIHSNLGNINSSGLPQIKIPLGTVTELARYGFTFAMTHNVIPGYNGSARTEWKISGLRTCVWLDDNGDLVWVRPNMQQLVFKKADNYRQERLGWTALVQNNTGDVELANSTGQKWKYRGGLLKTISDRFGAVDFITDQETVLLASRRDRAGNEVILMRAEYSDEGLLACLELGQSQPVIFHWSGTVAQTASLLDCPNAAGMKAGWQPALRGIEGLPAGGMTFDYDDMLLQAWDNNGVRTNYTWAVREGLAKNISFGVAPVRLQGDSEFRYEYGSDDNASILRVFRHDGSLVSETRFGGRGIIQKIGDKTIGAAFRNERNNSTGGKPGADSE